MSAATTVAGEAERAALLEAGTQPPSSSRGSCITIASALSAVALAAGGLALWMVKAGGSGDEDFSFNGTNFTEEGCPVDVYKVANDFMVESMELTVDEARKAISRLHDRETKDRSIWDHLNRIDPESFSTGPGDAQSTPPPDITRVGTYHERCSCEAGVQFVTFWPNGERDKSVTVASEEVQWVKFDMAVTKISFFCDGMNFFKDITINAGKHQWISLQNIKGEKKNIFGPIGVCGGKETGLPVFNTWDSTDYTSSVPFTSGTEGYACIKIPALLRTQKGTLIAFAEARKETCSDFAQTDLVYKRSTDGGKSWGPLKLLVEVDGDPADMGLCGQALVIGNVAPVQLRADSKHHPGRILAPYSRNNYKVWMTYSDDDGETWQGDQEIPGVTNTSPDGPDCDRGMDYFGYDIDTVTDWDSARSLVKFAALLCYRFLDPFTNPEWKKKLTGPWQWVGSGPPGSLQLRSGRILVPAYHSYIRGKEGKGVLPISQLYNNLGFAHVMISDDGGDTWRLGDPMLLGQGGNENQLTQLENGDVLLNSRSLATGSPQYRLQARSTDDGETFTETKLTLLPQPFNGCQGSTIGINDTVYVASPDPPPATTLIQKAVDKLQCNLELTGRNKVSVWRSTNGGKTYPEHQVVDPGLSAQTSMQFDGDGKVVMLYEQADPAPQWTVEEIVIEKAVGNLRVLLPSRFVYREVPNNF